MWKKWDDLKDYLKDLKYYHFKYKKNDYITYGMSFDIETTSILEGDEKLSWIYHWQLGFKDCNFLGRYADDIKTAFDMICDSIGNARVICWVHNLAYEFTYLSTYIEFTDTFAKSRCQPIYARYRNIEFRCSYAFSNMSLALLARQYCTTQKGKDFNYNEVRYPETVLTDEEISYCENDTQILLEYWDNHIYPTYIANTTRPYLPMTNTAKVRKDMKSRIINYKQYHDCIVKAFPDIDIYNILRSCFYGGLVRANPMYTTIKLLNCVRSFDRTSSYPAVELHYDYPMGRFFKINIDKEKDYSNDEYCKMYLVQFKDIQAKTTLSTLPSNKIIHHKGVQLDNGRVYKAEFIELYLTDIDLQITKEWYSGKCRIVECYVSKKGYLPKFMIESLSDYYHNKMTLKGVTDKIELYMKSKNMLNSNFGCCVQKHCDKNHQFVNNEWVVDDVDYKLGYSEFLLYQWGVWITAYARMELLNMASNIIYKSNELNIENPIVYMDTDSIKLIDKEGVFVSLINERNEWYKQRTIERCVHYNIAPTKFDKIAYWDDESNGKPYEYFMTLGTKRYIHDDSIVVSGLPKKTIENACRIRECKPRDLFYDGVKFPTHEKGQELCTKVTMTYIYEDAGKEICYLIDGKEYSLITARNRVHAMPATFKISITESYKEFFEDMQKLKWR